MGKDILYDQAGIKKEAPENVKKLCLCLLQLRQEHEDWARKLGEIDWFKNEHVATMSRVIWLRMNYLERRMNELRQYIFMAWQNKEPSGIVEETEQEVSGNPEPIKSSTPFMRREPMQ
ncbi:MAG: hypothetical protein FJY85_17130 [Deltaproteobacteria bacterium]|nr:hypothetical protein [Deltaproteobacteria bacterium]